MLAKVVVLLSTYNGENFIKEQLDSIINQTYKNIELIVRDDGSSYQTIEILKEYEKQGKIQLILGENKGFINSFFELLKLAPQANYYAFSDQDDIWEKDKIERAVKILEEQSCLEIPLMYYSNYDFYNSNMEFLKHPQKRDKISFINSLLECVNAGMATLINQKAREKILYNLPKQNLLGHDWWIYMVCSAFGKVIYDDISKVRHRMHSSNTSTKDYREKKKPLEGLTNNKHFPKVKKQIEEFANCYYKDLNQNQKQMIELFIKDTNYKNQLKKIFYPRKIMNLWKEEIILRIGFLLKMI